MRLHLVAHLAAFALALPGLAQTAPGPQVSVALDPDGPVTVGSPIKVTATVLVPTWMPDPPAWPDLQIADAITTLPERATHPVTERIGRDTWSGVARTWQIVPQRPADYDLGQPQVAVTYADPDTNQPVAATLALPAIAFSATVPPGAEGIDPFLAATDLAVTATVDGLPAAPKPGDAFILTLTTTASGLPAMLLPPLADRIATPAGLRAYPRQPVLADGPPATRTETIAYAIEAPGSYLIPAISLDWWNTATAARETAATDPIPIEVAGPRTAAADGRPVRPTRLAALVLATAAAALVAAWLLRPQQPRPPAPNALHRRLLHSARHAPPATIRHDLAAWRSALPAPPAGADLAAIDAALHALERLTYGPPDPAQTEPALRARLIAAITHAHPLPPAAAAPPLPPLNPAIVPDRGA